MVVMMWQEDDIGAWCPGVWGSSRGCVTLPISATAVLLSSAGLALAHKLPLTRLYLHDGATPNCWLGLNMLSPPPVLPIPLEPTFACHCHRYGQRWSSLDGSLDSSLSGYCSLLRITFLRPEPWLGPSSAQHCCP